MNQLPQPKNWQDFEELCLRLWREIWSDPDAQKNGRVGQPQKGVDIFGLSSYDNSYHGVQCKGKNANYGAQLNDEEIKTEADNADGFEPKLSSFVMATTAPRDEELQEYCRKLNEQNKHVFTVAVWSWDDIEEELQYRPDVFRDYEPYFDHSGQESLSIKINKFTSKERLYAFFTRPAIGDNTSTSMRILLNSVFYELIQNSFWHGEARQCMLAFDDFSFTLIDDGNPFDPHSLLDMSGQGGSATLKKLYSIFDNSLFSKYDYKENSNIFTLRFAPTQLRKIVNTIREFIIDQTFRLNRNEAIQLAKNQMSSLDETEIAYAIFSQRVPLSNIIAYIQTSVSLIGANRIRVSIPSSMEEYKASLARFNIEIIVR